MTPEQLNTEKNNIDILIKKDIRRFKNYLLEYFSDGNYEYLKHHVVNYKSDVYNSIRLYFTFFEKPKLFTYPDENLFEVLKKALASNDYIHLTYAFLVDRFYEKRNFNLDFLAEYFLIPPFFPIFFKEYSDFIMENRDHVNFNVDSSYIFSFFNIKTLYNEEAIRICLLFNSIFNSLLAYAHGFSHIFPISTVNQKVFDKVMETLLPFRGQHKLNPLTSRLEGLAYIIKAIIFEYINKNYKALDDANKVAPLVKEYIEAFIEIFKLFKTTIPVITLKKITMDLLKERKFNSVEEAISELHHIPILKKRQEFFRKYFPNLRDSNIKKARNFILSKSLDYRSKLFFLRTLENLSFLLNEIKTSYIDKDLIKNIIANDTISEDLYQYEDFIEFLKKYDGELDFENFKNLVYSYSQNYKNQSAREAFIYKFIAYYKSTFYSNLDLLEFAYNKKVYNYEIEFLFLVYHLYAKIFPTVRKDVSNIFLQSSKLYDPVINEKYPYFLEHYSRMFETYYSDYLHSISQNLLPELGNDAGDKLLNLVNKLYNTNFIKKYFPNLGPTVIGNEDEYYIRTSFKIEDIYREIGKNPTFYLDEEVLKNLIILSSMEKLILLPITNKIHFNEDKKLGSSTYAKQLVLVNEDTLKSILSNFVLKKALSVRNTKKSLTMYFYSPLFSLFSLTRRNLKNKILSLYRKEIFMRFKLLEFYVEKEKLFEDFLKILFEVFTTLCDKYNVDLDKILEGRPDIPNYNKFLLYITYYGVSKPFSILFSKAGLPPAERNRALLDIKAKIHSVFDVNTANLILPVFNDLENITLGELESTIKKSIGKGSEKMNVIDTILSSEEPYDYDEDEYGDIDYEEDSVTEFSSLFKKEEVVTISYEDYLKDLEMESYRILPSLNLEGYKNLIQEIFKRYKEWPYCLFTYRILEAYAIDRNFNEILIKLISALKVRQFDKDFSFEEIIEYLAKAPEEYDYVIKYRDFIVENLLPVFEEIKPEHQILFNQFGLFIKEEN